MDIHLACEKKTAACRVFGGYIQHQRNVSLVLDTFSSKLAKELHLVHVRAPILSRFGDGTQDNLSGHEKAVQVKVKALQNHRFEIVHSLAKWKRMTLSRYSFPVGQGLCTDMKALRPDEDQLSPLHSVFVDQWDWELVMCPENRNITFLKDIVTKIYKAIKETEMEVSPQCGKAPFLPETITFVHSEDLVRMYPSLDSKARENAIAREYGAVFLIGIGGRLSDGNSHDVRAPDYDDWTTPTDFVSDPSDIGRKAYDCEVSKAFPTRESSSSSSPLETESSPTAFKSDDEEERNKLKPRYKGLNGDILVWNPVLERAFELSSMGIRVNPDTLRHQLSLSGEESRAEFDWHQSLLKGEMPQTIGGGIGQSRLVMLMLQAPHIGQVQCGVWGPDVHESYDGIL